MSDDDMEHRTRRLMRKFPKTLERLAGSEGADAMSDLTRDELTRWLHDRGATTRVRDAAARYFAAADLIDAQKARIREIEFERDGAIRRLRKEGRKRGAAADRIAVLEEALQAEQEAEDAGAELADLFNRADGEGWLGDPTGESHINDANRRVTALKMKARELRRAALEGKQ